MRIITGDECGLLKESIPELSRPKDDAVKDARIPVDVGVSRLGGNVDKMCRTRGVVDLSFCQSSGSQQSDDESGSLGFCALRANGSLEQWEGTAPFQSKEDRLCGGTYNMTHTVNNIFESKENKEDSCRGRPIAVCTALQYQNFTNTNRSNIVACCSSVGMISILNSCHLDRGVKAHYDAYSKSNSNTKLGYLKGNFTNRDMATAMAMDNEAKRVVVGGRERAVTMLDVETGEKIWKAKNLPHNPQTLLQQPIWSTAMQFLSQTDTEPFLGSTNLLAIGTAYKQLQIYDVRADATQRRPIIYTPEWDVNKENLLEHRVTSLCQLDSNKIAVGDSAGFITTLDLRKITNQRGRSLGASIGRFVGPAGSVRQIVKHERLPIISCVGLDRMMRTYDIQSRKELDCVYLKQRLNCMLFCADGTWNSEEDTVGVEETFDNDVVPEGNIDDDDEVVDYVDSSNDELSDGDAAPDDEIEEDSESDEEMDGDTGSDGDSDEEAVSSDQSSSEDVKEKPKAKRRRK